MIGGSVPGILLLLGTLGCTGGTETPSESASTPERATIPSPHPLPAPVDGDPRGIALATLPFAELSIPPDSRGGAPIGAGTPLRGLKPAGGDEKTGFTFTAPNPIKPRTLFFFKPLPGLRLQQGGVGEVPYQWNPRRTTHLNWKMTRDEVTVRSKSPEVPTDLTLLYPRSVERERGMHFATARAAGLVTDEADFVRTAVQDGWTSHEGLLLPAPAKASFEVEIPASGVLTFAPGLARPELADLEPSDGCTLKITVDGASVFEEQLTVGPFEVERLDLSAHAGKKVVLGFESLPGGTALNDFCFVGEPVLSAVKKNPRRVVMVFLDTLRPDHMSLYGWERPTTPGIDAWAKDAAVFDQARSVAPWTLPSARTVVTGRHPELYFSTKKLPELLGDAGFATGMIAGNVYLTANFGMQEGWDHHTVDLFPPAGDVTDQALAWLGDHQGQDAALMVHYMTAHLPYKEPEPYKSMWAGERPPQILHDNFILNQVQTALRQGLDDKGKQYVRDRYDQVIRWLDTEVARLLSALDEDDVVVVFSDHGEELWDHAGYEHGHTLYDELLRVPLVIRGPGVTPGRFDTPVSLLDVTPTVLDVLGLPTEGMDGTSLVKVTTGDATLRGMLADRPQTVGRPLYGRDRWGVIDGTKKYTTHEGHESVFDLAADPGELHDLGDAEALVAPLREAMGEGIGTSAPVSWRLLPSNNATMRRDVTVVLDVPGGVRAAFKGGDPHQRTGVTIAYPTEERVSVTWHRGGGGREVYVVPNRPIEEVTPLLKGELHGGNHFPWTPMEGAPKSPAEGRRRIAQLDIPEGAVTIYWGMAPIPPDGSDELDATDDESTDALEKLGYAEGGSTDK
ncbi:MAG: sulfatase [Alphaproteobacteria bacterium]|nr:sulfatase [Alphaproteobacteria bacterium]